MKYDVVIIGSGFGGLTCARLLSKAGMSVIVLERQVQPGGCIQSYRRGKYSMDTGLHYVGGLGEGQRLNQLFSHMGLMDLPWHRLDADGFDRITIGERNFAFAEGYERFVDTLATDFPQEKESLKQYVELLSHMDDYPVDTNRELSLLSTSAYDYLTRLFHDPLLVDVLAGACLKLELRRESLPLFTFAHCNYSFIQSSWRLQGDGNMLVRKLTDDISSDGGVVTCSAEVCELVEDGGQIVAAKCSNGEVYEGKTFISDIHPLNTFELVKKSSMLKRLFRMRMSMMENTFGMFTVSLVLKPHSLSYFNHNKFVYRDSTVWEKPSLFVQDGDTQKGVDRVMISCRVPEMSATSDDGLLIDLLTPVPWKMCERWEATRVGHRGEDYRAMKKQLADECVALAETVIPGLSSMVSEMHTSTPLTYRDYSLIPEGSAYGVRKDYRNVALTVITHRTPISNLLLTGQNLMLHGLEGVCMTTLLTCSDLLGKDYMRQIIKK